MSHSKAPSEVRTYGNWRRPRAAGLGKLSFGASITLIGVLLVTFILFNTLGLMQAGVALVVGGSGVWATTIQDRHGVALTERLKERIMFALRSRRKENIYRSGPLSRQKTAGRFTPPGILAPTTISEHVDAYERPFALLHHGDGTLAVVLSASPTGAGLLDQDTVDNQVAVWGAWLSDLAGELGVVGASVCIESAPDSGQRLARQVRARLVPTAPPVATHVMNGVLDEYKVGAAQVRAWLTLTFDPSKMGVKKRGDAQVREIASRLPGIIHGLTGTGAGAIHLLTAAEISRLVRVAYDPNAEQYFEDAAQAGEQLTVGWRDCGPASAHAHWDYYRHDSGLSRTWTVPRPPRGIVQSHILRQILDTNRDVTRKRVTILYRPVDAALAPDVVERDLLRARTKVEINARPTARDMAELNAAQLVAADEANGAGLVDFGFLVTATTTDHDLDDTAAATMAIGAASRLQMRVAYGAQDSAFALCLPLGLRPFGTSI